MSKVEGGGVRLTPPPSKLRVTIFSGRLLGLTQQLEKNHTKLKNSMMLVVIAVGPAIFFTDSSF